MAKAEHLAKLKNGVKAWNAWRLRDVRMYIDLRDADLSGADLSGADLSHADLREMHLLGAKLYRANLYHSDLNSANLGGANATGANLMRADLSYADLSNANLMGAELSFAKLDETRLTNANLTSVVFLATTLANLDLGRVDGLETCEHRGPSIVDYRTLAKSGRLPLAFLRGVGLPDALIEYLPSLLNQPIQHYSCFISHSTKDHDFSDRLYADLQNKGVRCWFAPHDMPIGGRIVDEIDTAIRLRDKLLLILSEHSIKSDWVEDEVSKAFEEERKRSEIVLFPVRLDDAVFDTDEPRAAKLRAQRHIGDFTRWKDHNAYKVSFDRVIRDLARKPKRG